MIMMEYLIACLALLFSGAIGVLSFALIDCLKSGEEASEIKTNTKNKPVISLQLFKNALTTPRVIFLCISLAVNCYAYYRTFTFDLTTVAVIKLFLTITFVMSAMFIDKELKKIPNILILSMLGTEIVFILLEYFILEQEVLQNILISSGIGLIGCFFAMTILSLITKGGMGMGDVKLISMLGFLMGIGTAFYTLVYSMIVCFLFALPMLAFGKKKMKDGLPFAPFIYAGLIMAVVFGTF